MAFIKSYSNYVLKRKHQDINSGSIYERDITTIGGLNQFAKGQVPIYKSSNFIITVNNENKISRNHLNKGWEKNGSEDVWTLSNINASNDVESAEKTLKIVLKQDYYRLRDFAYFGSCVELIRASIIDIINRFPGELHVPTVNEQGIPVFYTSKDILKDENGNVIKEGDNGIVRLGGDDWYLVDNPHNINIHTININEDDVENKLKYLCLSRDKYNVTSHTVKEYACINGNYGELTPDIKKNISSNKVSKLGVGAKVADITIDGISIGAFVGNNGEIVYLTKSNLGESILQPIEEVKNEFFDSLDNFQKILMNKDSNPKYTALFEVISENSFGYITELKSFTFPTTFGGNNLATDNAAFNVYINSLQKYAEFYDEYFCDNIWRSMTHESIKNFDWTYTREYGVGEEEEYVFGGTRMQKTLRLIGREFDEIKTYIDALKNYQKVDYGKGNAIPDYFLTDAVNQEGWNIENIYPYNSELKQVQFLENVTINPYSQTLVSELQQYGYFYKCEGCEESDDIFKPSFITGTSDDTKQEIYDECLGVIRPRIKQYISDKEYTFSDVNNHFMRMLKLNSKNIFRKKGTIQGIETLLSLFGLKSKRWCEAHSNLYKQYRISENTTSTNDENVATTNDETTTSTTETTTSTTETKIEFFETYKPDYEIKEYITKVNSTITDTWIDEKEKHLINWYNSTKTIGYDTDDYRNGVYHDYQGLPLRCYVKINNKYCDIKKVPENFDNTSDRYLYPYFSKDKIIDGNPYYQMYGGWLNRNYSFTNDNELITRSEINLHKETYRNIRSVDTIKDLINLPKSSLKNGEICIVKNLEKDKKYILVDGVIHDVFKDNIGFYIKTNIYNNSAKVGSKIFASELTVSDSSVSGNLMKYVFNEYKEGSEIRIYVLNNTTIQAFGKYYGINNFTLFQGGRVSSFTENEVSETSLTNYFKLNSINNKTELYTNHGWIQLDENVDSEEIKRIESIVDNFKGNNPHTGHMSYDGGKEYLSYFITLFKHALEGNQFNERCYGDAFFSTMNNLKSIGWKELDEGSEGALYCYPEYEDRKIHYFGNKLSTTTSTTDDTKKIVSYNTSLSKNETSLIEHNTIYGNNVKVSEQIINIKRVDINFYSSTDISVIKFFDNVIMNYLEQVLPSTLIINVNYGQQLESTTEDTNDNEVESE